MTELSFENPEAGEARSGSDTKIRAALVATKEVVNGKLGSVNLENATVTDAKLASPNNPAYRNILSDSGGLGIDLATGTYILGTYNQASGNMRTSTQGIAFGGGNESTCPEVLYFDDADYLVAGKTLKMRLRAQVSCNATKAAIKFTFGLYPLTVAGAADTLELKLGTVVTGSTVEINEPAASIVSQAVNSDFTVPADGAYCLGVLTSGTLTNNSGVMCSAQLQVRNV